MHLSGVEELFTTRAGHVGANARRSGRGDAGAGDPANPGDSRQARGIEGRDPMGTVVLAGQIDDDDIEKDARLAGAVGARGEADIEIDDDDQERELEVRGLAPNQTLSIRIDAVRSARS